MAARDPKARSRAASIASNSYWAMVPNRTEARACARAKSPTSFEYWREWAKTQHPNATAADQLAAAKNAHSAHMRRMANASAKARAARKAGTATAANNDADAA